MRYFLCFIFILCIVSPALGAETFTLTSPDFKHRATLQNDQVYNSFGCSGKNLSPALAWKNAPAGTKSFALTVYDPDEIGRAHV